jgi:hypothetical protein
MKAIARLRATIPGAASSRRTARDATVDVYAGVSEYVVAILSYLSVLTDIRQ